ncbi:hypothetical protein CEXT_169931 [Caerostris extrusa]|uniref:Uncharacterized protein n=1 Tax=Caerostris extrusa TaxID=172846 RepID=A0AAV4UM28_CAEEX|nr:hypothetical protein CEXT_169931 [Caerostris extrusa]
MSILIPIPTGVLQKKCKKTKKIKMRHKGTWNPCPLKWQTTVLFRKKRSISREQIELEVFKSFSDLLHRTDGTQSSCKMRAAKKLSTESEYLIDLGKAQKEERK